MNTGAAKQLQDFSEKNLQVTGTGHEVDAEVTTWTYTFGWTALSKSNLFFECVVLEWKCHVCLLDLFLYNGNMFMFISMFVEGLEVFSH